MYCKNCGAELTRQSNFCPNCGSALQSAQNAVSLPDEAAPTAQSSNRYNLVLVSKGNCNETMAGDLLEDVFGYTDAESARLVKMAPVVVGENLTAEEAATIARMYTEYGLQVSITDSRDQYVDLSDKAASSVFDSSGKLLSGAAAIIGALTVANRISSFRRYKKPSLLARLFRFAFRPSPPGFYGQNRKPSLLERLLGFGYRPTPPSYRRNFRPHLEPNPVEPRRKMRRPPPMFGRGPQRMPGRFPGKGLLGGGLLGRGGRPFGRGGHRR